MQQDSDSSIVKQCYAVIFTPSRKRKRFPENCVEVVESLDQALDKADPDQNKHPARVMGPFRSSEGLPPRLASPTSLPFL